jgi:hypothetical protein
MCQFLYTVYIPLFLTLFLEHILTMATPHSNFFALVKYRFFFPIGNRLGGGDVTSSKVKETVVIGGRIEFSTCIF